MKSEQNAADRNDMRRSIMKQENTIYLNKANSKGNSMLYMFEERNIVGISESQANGVK